VPQSVEIAEFFQGAGPILDVRSPSEFAQGHLPDALNLPLFGDDERAAVGICYKQQGRDAAVELGFALAGPRFAQLIAQARSLAPARSLRLHCWRGGLRSSGVGWVLETGGFEVITLAGGYKAFRHWVRQQLSLPRPVQILAGMTGTNKTGILQALAAAGEQVLDLEALASHRGSSYGGLALPPQPTTEHFENQIAWQWAAFDPTKPVWIEAESRRIGTCRIPDELFQQMEAAPALEITRPLAERLDLLEQLYGQVEVELLIAATERIRKRLGGQRTQAAQALLQAHSCREAFAIILDYYDRSYRYDLERRQQHIPQVDVGGCTPAAAAQRLLQAVQQGAADSRPATALA
jgi:tRNA 2-selenouridine synthase